MNSETILPQCHYKHLKNGIHEFIFLTNTREAVDNYFTLLEATRLAQAGQNPGLVCVLVELREAGMPPVSYMMHQYRNFVKAHHDHMPETRVVYLYRSGFILSVVRSFLSFISERKHVNRRFLPVSEREHAVAWLLEEQAVSKKNPLK